MSKIKCYLAGKMSGLNFETMNNWRRKAKSLLEYYEIQTINPVDFYNFEMDRKDYTDKEVKEFDLLAIKLSSIVLVNLEYPDTIGTAIELHMAQEWGIPVIAFGRTKERPVHPWMDLCITKECDTMADAINHIMGFYAPILF